MALGLGSALIAIIGGCGAPDIGSTLWRCQTGDDCGEGWTCNVPTNTCEPAADGEGGIYQDRVVLGMTGPLGATSGAPVQLGLGTKAGIEAFIGNINRLGGVQRRRLELKALDDGYEPARALQNMQSLVGGREVFAMVGSVGTPTANVTAPYAIEQRTLFFGGVTGAAILRRDPPDRYIFNFRASYRQETERAVGFFAATRQPPIPLANIGVFAQGTDAAGTLDEYGQSGFDGVSAAVRARAGGSAATPAFATYPRGTSDVTPAVSTFLRWLGGSARTADNNQKISALVVMAATPKPGAVFVKDLRREVANLQRGGQPNAEYGLTADEIGRIRNVVDLEFSMLSFGGDTDFADELRALGSYTTGASEQRRYCEGIVVTQVVPYYGSNSTAVLQFRDHLAAYVPNARPSFAALEGYLMTRLLVAALEKQGRGVTPENFIDTLESLGEVNLGLGTTLGFSPNDHQALDKVWGVVLDADCGFKSLDDL